MAVSVNIRYWNIVFFNLRCSGVCVVLWLSFHDQAHSWVDVDSVCGDEESDCGLKVLRASLKSSLWGHFR